MPFTENDNPFSLTANFLLSPVHGLLESGANISFPGIGIPGQGIPGAQWLLDQPIWGGVEDFQDDHPFLAGVGEVLSYLVPGGAYAKLGKGLGAIPGLTRAAASFGGTSPAARFALGETARWAPLTAGTVGFDYAAGRYESPGQAVTDFVMGTALGGALSVAGASPAFRNAARQIPVAGPAISKGLEFFGPTPPQRALYGLGDELREDPAIRELAPLFREEEPDHRWGRTAYQALGEVESGARPATQRNTLLDLMDNLRQDVFKETTGAGEYYARFNQPTDVITRRMVNAEFTPGAAKNGTDEVGRRETLTQRTMQTPNDWRRIGEELALPRGWEFNGRFFRHRTALDADAGRVRRRFGLLQPTDKPLHKWRRVQREVEGPNGTYSQPWSIMNEDDGSWLLATELPRVGKNNRFLYFKTDVPEEFFPDMMWAKNIDNPWDFRGFGESLGQRAWELDSHLPRGVSGYLDKSIGLKETILSPENFAAFRQAAARGNRDATKILSERLSRQSPPGANPGAIIEHYLKPTNFQFRNNPQAALVWNFRNALMDMFEGEGQAILFGKRKLNQKQSVWQGLWQKPDMGAEDSLYAATQNLFKDQDVRNEFQKFYFHEGRPIEQWPEGPAKEYYKLLTSVNEEVLTRLNQALGAIGEEKIPFKKGHIGVSNSHSALGSNFYEVLDFQGKTVALGVGNSAAGALKEANRWIQREVAERGSQHPYRVGKHFTAEKLEDAPIDVRENLFRPGYFNERAGVGGFKYDLDQIDDVDEWLGDLVNSYISRFKHTADRLGKALTAKEFDAVLRHDPATGQLLTTRINQLKGSQLGASVIQNRVMDKALAPIFGVNSATKIANALNEGMYHLSLGMGNLAHPVINTTSILQTTLPELSLLRTANVEELSKLGYVFPMPNGQGKPSGGMAMIIDPLKSLWEAGKVIKSSNERHIEGFQRMADTYKLGPRFVEEFTGEANRHAARALADGIKSADDLGEWFKGVSSWLPANSEKFARAWTAASTMHMMDTIEKARGIKFSDEQYFQNTARAIDRTNAVFAQPGRELIFTSPLGSVFGSMKHWMVNYLYLLADYTGLAMKEGNFAPILTALGSTATVGGLFAVPFAGASLDWMTETFADKDLMEYMYENLGDGANGVAFGLPALMGVSLSGATGAPGSHLSHDVEFLAGVVALDRMGNMGRSLGRWWDLQAITGQDPWTDPIFVQQFLQGFSPRSLYRAFDVYSDATLSSARTGNPMVTGLNPYEQLQSALGFTPVEVEREYAIYDRLLRDRDERAKMIGYFGEAFFRASAARDTVMMEEVLRTATMRGLDISSIMRSANTRARNHGVDMFGRNLPEELLSQYDDALPQ